MAYWDRWWRYVAPLGMDPHLQEEGYIERVQILTGFAGQVQSGSYGWGQRVQTSTVSSSITAVEQTVALACGINPTKMRGGEKMIPRLQQTLDR